MAKDDPTRQHHVPKVYLKNFCDQNGDMQVMDKLKRRIFPARVVKVGVENDFYTIKTLEDPYCWEKAYSSGVEPLMADLFRSLISRTNILVQNGATVITSDEKAQLATIMIVQLLRGKQSRKYMEQLYAEHLPRVLSNVKTWFGPLNNEQNTLLKAFEIDDSYIKQIAMGIAFDKDRMVKYIKILSSHIFLLYRIQGDKEFVTSDNPVMFVNSVTNNASPFVNGLLNPATLIYYPISPKLLLCAAHPSSFFGVCLEKDCKLIDLDASKEIEFISFLNKQQISQCYRQAFANSTRALD